MVGIVKFINVQTNVIALKTTLNEYSIIEVTELDMLEKGDVLLGEINSLGVGTLFNISKNCMLNVIVHKCCVYHTDVVKVLNYNTQNM